MSVVSVTRITDPLLDKYDVLDSALIPSKSFLRNFGDPNDYIECHIYTKDDKLLYSQYDIKDYTLPSDDNSNTNQIIFDPGKYLTDRQYNVGDFKLDYRIYRKKVFTLPSPTFFITEISKDRTEIRLSSNLVSNLTVETGALNFINEMQTSQYYKDFLLNFGDNKAVNAVNLALDRNTSPYSLIVKLYQPLPTEFALKSALWIVEELASPIVYEVVLTPDFKPTPIPYLASADFDVDVYQHAGLASPYVNLDTIYNNSNLQAYQDVVNRLHNDSINVNVDYTDYSNFVHFSSAQQRLVNFIYKLGLIEDYGADIATLNSIPDMDTSVSGSAQALQGNINNLIKNMDGYEKYLYTVSSSFSWPKIGTAPNYTLYSVTSSQAQAWVGDVQSGQIGVAYEYDAENQNNLVFGVPGYLADDERNGQYLVFLNMIGQHFDSIWVYIKAINDIHKAENSLDKGISKDMVYTALRSLGVKLYNNNANQDIYSYLIGNLSGSYTITGSQDLVSGEDQSKELFKRIYHNLPYLLKSKGTTRGIQNLITMFGIPDTILSPITYGGADKSGNTKEYTYDRYSYSLQNTSGSYVKLLWGPLTQNYLKYGVNNLVPDAIEFRIKPDKNTYANNAVLLQCYKGLSRAINFGVTMDYTSSQGVPSANFKLIMTGPSGLISSSLCLPVYATGSDGDTSFYNVAVSTDFKIKTSFSAGNIRTYTLTVQNNISGRVGHHATASIANPTVNTTIGNSWGYPGSLTNPNYLAVGGPAVVSSTFSQSFAGQIQELRYWSEPLVKSIIDVHTLNNESIQGNSISSSYTDLAARFPLGNNLVTYNHYLTQSVESVHPNWGLSYSSGSVVSGSGGTRYGYAIYGGTDVYGQPITGSILYRSNTNSASFYNYPNTNNYKSEYELIYANTPNAGYYSPVTDKIRIFDNTPASDVLSPWLSLETPELNRSRDTHFTEVSFSPQNEINKDITADMGSLLDLDQYLGDPYSQELDNYPELVTLSKQYYGKYVGKYNYKSYVDLVSQVDNTLFKMIEDFIPARTNLSTGVTIKSPILERNKVKRYQPVVTQTDYSATITHGGIEASTDNISGDYSGSFIDIHDNFEVRNYNPYLLYTSSFDENMFEYSDFNITYGDVYTNRLSGKYKKIDINNTNILEPVELQDSEYEHTRYTNPRYKGCKVDVAKLNVYTKGDNTYGTVPGASYNVGKFGYVFQGGMNNLNFPDKTSITMKYLLDASGSSTQLTKANKNVFEVQNTFKSGDTMTVSLTDPLNPSNQFGVNGTGSIFLGGYAIHPILYNETGLPFIFTYLNPKDNTTSKIGFKAATDKDIRWYTYNGHDGRGPDTNESFALQPSVGQPAPDKISDYIRLLVDGAGVNTTFPQLTTQNRYGTITDWNTRYPDIQAGYGTTWYTNPNGGAFYQTYGPQYQTSDAADYLRGWYEISYFSTQDTGSQGYVSSGMGANLELNGGSLPSGDDNYLVFNVPRTSDYIINADIPISVSTCNPELALGVCRVVGVLEKWVNGAWTYIPGMSTSISDWRVPKNEFENGRSDLSGFDNGDFGHAGTMYFWNGWYNSTEDRFIDATLNMNKKKVHLESGDKVRFMLYFLDLAYFFQGGWYVDFKLNSGASFEIVDSLNSVTQTIVTQSFSDATMFTLTSSLTPGYADTLLFDVTASLLYSNSIYTPSSSYTSLYSPITDIFTIQPNDLVRLASIEKLNAPLYQVRNVITPIVSGSSVSRPLQVVLNQAPISSSVNPSSFSILRPVPDETSIILNKTKQTGMVSSGVLIPEYLDPNVINNISNIIEPLSRGLLPQ